MIKSPFTSSPTMDHHAKKKHALSSKEEVALLNMIQFDMDKCLSLQATINQETTILSMFKGYLEREQHGKYLPLLPLYIQMKQNPSYYDNSLYGEKKFEIECFLKMITFARFIRTEGFRNYIVNTIRYLKQTQPTLQIPAICPPIMDTKLSNSSLVSDVSFGATTSSLDDAATIVSSTGSSIRTLGDTIYDQHVVDELLNSEEDEGEETEKEHRYDRVNALLRGSDADELSSDTASSDDEEEEPTRYNQGRKENFSSKTYDTILTNYKTRHLIPSTLLNIKAVSDFVLSVGRVNSGNMVDPNLFKTKVELKSALFLSFQHIHLLEYLEQDSPDWDIVYTIPSTVDYVSSCKNIPVSVHREFIMKGGGSFSFQINSSKQALLNDLPLEKTHKWKFQVILPYSCHEVFQMLDQHNFNMRVSKQRHSKTSCNNNDILDPHQNNPGGRDFYCHEEGVNISSQGSSIFRFGTSADSKTLNCLETLFYDPQKNQYLHLSKSLGYDSIQNVTENSWGIKMLTITKITNCLTRVCECGFMYFGDTGTKDYFLSPLLTTKDKPGTIYPNLVCNLFDLKRELDFGTQHNTNALRIKCLNLNDSKVLEKR